MKKTQNHLLSTTGLLAVLLLFSSCDSKQERDARLAAPLTENIRINQLGYIPGWEKNFYLADIEAAEFQVIDSTGKIVFKGELKDHGKWEASGEELRSGNFSGLQKEGTYIIHIPDIGNSYPFSIAWNIYEAPSIAAMRSFYFQRMSQDMPEKYLGSFAREMGHPDDSCYFHPSSGHKKGFISSPGGWYDAGDYGKYVVNAAISMGQMLNLYELRPDIYPDGSLNIPESGNGISDLLDELRYEFDWMLTMQDSDGGVFHKVTTLQFDGVIMPSKASARRYVIGKSTAATLDFAANLAQASRIYKTIDAEFSSKCLDKARKAYSWALSNPEEYFSNPPDVGTGGYGDRIVDEEFFWAAAELFVTTGESEYYDAIASKIGNITFRLEESWRNYADNIGYYSLYASDLLKEKDRMKLEDGILKLANTLIEQTSENAYNIPISRFVWGSNSDVLNTTIIQVYAYQLTGDQSYLNYAASATDYVFGKNATGYCFVSGFGSKSTMNFHHRLFMADENEEPFPGFIAGGPNYQMQDAENLKKWNKVEYPSTLPAKAYIDHEGSYASNELCLNWNAPLVFVLGFLNQELAE